MAYYLGKNSPGNLADVLSGAYAASSPSTSVPATGAEPVTAPNATTGNKDDLIESCKAKCGGMTEPCFSQCLLQAGGADDGQPCTVNLGCKSRNCVNGICTSAGGGPNEPECSSAKPCPPGVFCINGKCVPGKGGACEEGKTCKGQGDCPGGKCVGAKVDSAKKIITPGKCQCAVTYCDTAHPCPAGQTCKNGVCVDGGDAATCPEGTGGTALEGCPCGTLYNTLTGKCATGYKFVKRPNNGVRDDWAKEIAPVPGAVGTCECEKWITPGKKGLGEFKYPPEMQALMDLLLSRGKEFMGLTPGYSQAAQDKMFGRGFENVRGQETGQRQALESGLSRQGMLGTGAGQGMLNDLSWQTEGNVTNLARDLFIGNEEKKKQDLLDYTTAAQSVLGGGMGYQQLLEAINSARRGEGSSALQALLAWLLAQQ